MAKKRKIPFGEQLRRIVQSHIPADTRSITSQPEDILTFLKNAGRRPTPVQRFVLKLIYKLELDDTQRDIEVWDRFREELVGVLTEVEFFQWLQERGLINLANPTDYLSEDANIWSVVLVWGRRGGKSAVCGFIAAYELYKLLHLWSPHDFFGVIDTEEIRVMTISTTEDQAKFVRNYAVSCIDGHPFFRDYKLHDNQERITFKTQKMIDRGLTEEELNERPGVVMATYPCNSRAVRGSGNIVIVYDEIAHMIRTDGSVMGDEQVVNAASPSQARFHKDGHIHAKTFYISDPLDEAGVFHQEYEQGMADKGKSYLVMQLPTVVANPKAVTSEYLKKEMTRLGEKGFQAAYEAQFTMGVTSFIESPEWLTNAFDPARFFTLRAKRGVWYYVGVDLGFERDKSAISVVHRTNDNEIVQDYLRVFWPEDYTNDEVMYADILDSLEAVYKEFEPRKTIIDQHEGRGMKFASSRFGLKIEYVHITEVKHSEMAKLFRSYLRSGKFKTSMADGETFRKELVGLRKEMRRNDIIRVQKPQGGYDDEFDATIRSVWAAIDEEFVERGVEQVKFERSVTAQSSARQVLARGVPSKQFDFRARLRGPGNRWGQRR